MKILTVHLYQDSIIDLAGVCFLYTVFVGVVMVANTSRSSIEPRRPLAVQRSRAPARSLYNILAL